MVAIRVFEMNDIPSFLVVDPQRLITKVEPIAQFKSRQFAQKKKPGRFSYWEVSNTRYYQLLNKSTAAPYLLENQGISRAERITKGYLLTIDLCPSTKPFAFELFNRLLQLSEESHKPIPITIAISGLWLISHPQEFQWLVAKEKEKKLAITWVNHSFSHVYYQDLPHEKNFLLSPETSIDTEVLLTEKYLLEKGVSPSIFFRFPGLVSNESLVKQMKQYGLIPLGTNAWLAELQERHQDLTPGGIILVHGNGNEPEGIRLVLPLLKKLTLLSITQAI